MRRKQLSGLASMTTRVVLLSSLLLLPLGAGLGCTPALLPVQQEARAPGIARITLDSIDGNHFVFMVWNETAMPITVDREAVRLITPHDRRGWDAGWGRRLVVVPPGGVHDVKMKFDLDGLNQGEQVQFEFSSALIFGGRPVPVPVPRITLRVGD